MSRGALKQMAPGSSLGFVDTEVLRRCSFIVNRRTVAQRRMEAMVVVVAQVPVELPPELADRLKLTAVDHIGLERVKERFDMSVLAGGPTPRHALAHAPRRQVLPKCDPEILAAAIGVEDEPETIGNIRGASLVDVRPVLGPARRSQSRAPIHRLPGRAGSLSNGYGL